MGKYILALDQGTTSSRALLVDHDQQIVGTAQQEFQQYFPKPGWVEHDAAEIWQTQLKCLQDVVQGANVRPDEIAAIGITNQRETTVVWDRETGKPIYPAIVWQDRRTAKACEDLKEAGAEEVVKSKTGLLLDPYFSGTKLRWILDHVDGANERAGKGELCFGTIDSWLVWNLTGGRVHVTDISNASRTLMLNIHSGEWDPELLQLFGIPEALLPEVKSNSEVYGYAVEGVAGARIPVAGMAGDQQAALFGQMCIQEGMAKNTYGTGCFMLRNTGSSVVRSSNRLVSTVAWSLAGKITYALEGSVFVAGALVQWLRDGLQLIESSAEIEALAISASTSDGVQVVPAFTGLGAPYWNPGARGTIQGLTRGSTRAHIAYACLEAIALQNVDVLEAMNSDTGDPLVELRVDGGASENNLLMQIQADLAGITVTRSTASEATALGAASFAGLAVGFWESVEELHSKWEADRDFEPGMPQEDVKKRLASWRKAVQRSLDWEEV